MTTMLVAEPPPSDESYIVFRDEPCLVTRVCSHCGPRKSVAKRKTPIPKGPFLHLEVPHLIETFDRHPWLEGSRVGALAQSLRDAVVSA